MIQLNGTQVVPEPSTYALLVISLGVVSYHTLKHSTGLTKYRASRYFARLPTRKAVSGSLALCADHFLTLPSDPAVANCALTIRIVFPLVRVTPASCSRPGLPATLGVQGSLLSIYLLGESGRGEKFSLLQPQPPLQP